MFYSRAISSLFQILHGMWPQRTLHYTSASDGTGTVSVTNEEELCQDKGRRDHGKVKAAVAASKAASRVARKPDSRDIRAAKAIDRVRVSRAAHRISAATAETGDVVTKRPKAIDPTIPDP